MSSIGISNSLFKKELNKKLRMKNIFNYYGLIEQTGSIFFLNVRFVVALIQASILMF